MLDVQCNYTAISLRADGKGRSISEEGRNRDGSRGLRDLRAKVYSEVRTELRRIHRSLAALILACSGNQSWLRRMTGRDVSEEKRS